MTLCALPECDNPLPKLAVDHLDPYCSSQCARIAFGQPVTKPRSRAQEEAQRKTTQPKPPVPRERNVAA